jgi:hypothetical protein
MGRASLRRPGHTKGCRANDDDDHLNLIYFDVQLVSSMVHLNLNGVPLFFQHNLWQCIEVGSQLTYCVKRVDVLGFDYV